MKFNDYFKDIPVLESDRLLLRPFGYDDIDQYLAFFTDREVQRYLGSVLVPKDREDAKRWIDNLNGRCLKSKLVFTWCIEWKRSNEIIGRCDLGGFVRKSMAEVSYYLSREMWNKGVMTEAMKMVLDFGFRNLNLHRIQACVLPDNAASLRLLEKLGFQREGLLRQYDYGKEFHDVVILSILDNSERYTEQPE